VPRPVRRLGSQEAYRLWSETYDVEPDNVILILEEELFVELLARAQLTGKVVLDVGCGTGRHWRRLLTSRPSHLHGVDSSPEMLEKLRARHPDASLHLRTGLRLTDFEDGSVDVVVSTLMLGYAPSLEDELREWTRVLRDGGEIVFTDVHPDAMKAGLKRAFTHGDETVEIEHGIVTAEALQAACGALDLQILHRQDRALRVTVGAVHGRHEQAAAYRRHAGTRMVQGFHLRKCQRSARAPSTAAETR